MSKAIRNMLSLLVSLALFSTLTVAQTSANGDKNQNGKEHHSRLAKAEFWQQHKENSHSSKPAQAPQASKPAKTAQLKPVSAKVSAGQKNQKPKQNASNTSQPSPKKAPAANKAKLQPKTKTAQTASLKQ
jgi:hypothetical protein